MNWTGPVQTPVTIARLQKFLAENGGSCEKRKIARVEGSGTNVLELYDDQGNHFASVGWRPFEKGLFLC